MFMTRSIALTVLACLLVPAAVLAEPGKIFNKPAPEIDPDSLIFVRTPDALGAYKAQVRISEKGEALFFETLNFDVEPLELIEAPQGPFMSEKDIAQPVMRGVQLMALQPDARVWLLERAAAGADIQVEIRLDDEIVFTGHFLDIVAGSDQLRQSFFRPIETEGRFIDLRTTVSNKFCIDDCYDDLAQCEEDFCYWEPDQYMCDIGCEEEFDECIALNPPPCTPPTCTPAVISTDSSTSLISSQYQGLSCLRDYTYQTHSVYYQAYYNTYLTTNRELRRNADCTTQWVTTSTTYSYNYCYRRTSFTCSGAFFFPSCYY